MYRSDLIREVSLRTGYTIPVCAEIIKEAFEVIVRELEAHGEVRIPHLGVFDVYEKKPTSVRHPETGELIQIEARKYPRFTPTDSLKERVRF